MKGAWPVLAALLVVLGVLAWFGAGVNRRSGPPLDPRSTDPDGTRAFFLLLDELGRDVSVASTLPTGDATVIVLTEPRSGVDELTAWVEAGGTAIVFDSFSSLAPDVVGTSSAPDPLPSCGLPVLDRATAVDVPIVRGFTGDGCFAVPAGGVMVATVQRGSGRVIAVGTDALVQNRRIALADNSVVAVGATALAPDPIVFLEPGAVGAGDESLVDLVPAAVWAALIQAAIAFAFYALYRSRRHGRPIVEVAPVQISGSELTRAAGRLLERTGGVGRAAELIGDDIERFVATRGGQTERLAALDDPTDGADLVSFAREAEAIRQTSKGDQS